MNVNKTKLPPTKGFTSIAGYETWFTGATLIEMGVFLNAWNRLQDTWVQVRLT